jgi:hypothetical protein
MMVSDVKPLSTSVPLAEIIALTVEPPLRTLSVLPEVTTDPVVDEPPLTVVVLIDQISRCCSAREPSVRFRSNNSELLRCTLTALRQNASVSISG